MNLSFRDRCSQNRHMNIHTNKITYKCKYCNYEFCNRCDKQKHTRTHFSEKFYKCDKSFLMEKGLKSHHQTHVDIMHTSVNKSACKLFNHTYHMKCY
jgi:hypothetical protein